MHDPTLDHIRSSIDAVDEEIIRLLGRRQNLTLQAMLRKHALGLPAHDPGREGVQAAQYRMHAIRHAADLDAVKAVFDHLHRIAITKQYP